MVSGNFSTTAALKKVLKFNSWLATVDAATKLVVAGNHDAILEKIGKAETQRFLSNSIYLENEEMTINNMNIWASPYSEKGKTRSRNNAFQSKEYLQRTLSQLPPSDGKTMDLLITHGPVPVLANKIPHTYHLWGHRHNSYGVYHRRDNSAQPGLLSVCAPIMDGNFRPCNLPVVIDILNRIGEEEGGGDAKNKSPRKEECYSISQANTNTVFVTLARTVFSASLGIPVPVSVPVPVPVPVPPGSRSMTLQRLGPIFPDIPT